jgi:diguanylate cyclase (GGDEF)-like protein/PAS domain S-box-containing protein
MSIFKHAIAFEQIAEKANDIILVTKADPLNLPGPEMIYVNPAFTALTGYTAEEALGQTPRILQGEKTDRATLDVVRVALEKKEAIRFEILNYTKLGQEYWLDCSIFPLESETGEIEYFGAIERDLTEYKKEEERLTKLASHDSLTGLLNRRVFLEHANVAMKNYKRHQTPFAILIIDVDDFKKINDYYGHDAGDKTLKKIVYFVRQSIRANDVAARFGGDEIIVCLTHVSEEEVKLVCDRLLENIQGDVVMEYNAIESTVSIGAALANPLDVYIDHVIKRADDALYLAKNAGKNCYNIDATPVEAAVNII